MDSNAVAYSALSPASSQTSLFLLPDLLQAYPAGTCGDAQTVGSFFPSPVTPLRIPFTKPAICRTRHSRGLQGGARFFWGGGARSLAGVKAAHSNHRPQKLNFTVALF